MTRLLTRLADLSRGLDRQADWLLPTAARLVFAAVLFSYFWSSAQTKLDGVLTPSIGAYAQIFPKAFEAVGYDPAQMGLWQWLVVLAGSWAEFVLPVLIVLGLLTRLAAFGMAGFVVVQSLTDVIGHGAAWGQWFDRAADATILDQRALWVFLLLVLVVKGAGPVSADRLLRVPFSRLAT